MSKEESKIATDPLIAKVEFEIAQWAVDFVNTYLKFLGSKKTVEDVARELFFDGIIDFRDHIRGLPYHAPDEFFKKYPDIAMLASPEEREQLEKLEMQSDC